MAIIQVHVGKKMIDDVLIDGGYKVIIIVNLIIQLSFTKSNPTPYNLRMANQTITKPHGLIKDLKIFVHGISYIVTFIVINNSVINSNYLMLLKCPWLRDAKVSHDGEPILLLYKKQVQLKPYLLAKNLVLQPKDQKS
jgi:hypothetical protein